VISKDTLRALTRDIMEIANSKEAKERDWKMGFIISMVCERNPYLIKEVGRYMQQRGTESRAFNKVLKRVRREHKVGQQLLFPC
jgi:hypothetical protein